MKGPKLISEWAKMKTLAIKGAYECHMEGDVLESVSLWNANAFHFNLMSSRNKKEEEAAGLALTPKGEALSVYEAVAFSSRFSRSDALTNEDESRKPSFRFWSEATFGLESWS